MKTDRKARSSRKTPFAASLALACTLAAGSAGAGIPVTDVGNMPNHIITQISSYTSQFQALAEYGETLKRWEEELRQYQEALAQTTSMFTSAGLPMSLEMRKRPENHQVAERCPSPDGSGGLPSLSDLFSAFVPNLDGDVYEEQQRVCVHIVTLQNKKYNELVDMLTESENRKREIERTIAAARADKTDGAQKAAQIKMQDLIGKSMAEMQYSQARVNAFDGMIATLNDDQVALANKAFKGSTSPLAGLIGSLVQGATLEIALQELRTERDAEAD